MPLTNYSPFVKSKGDYYICVSSNLPHYINMQEHKKAHILIIEDEQKASHIYARQRLYFSASCEVIKNPEDILNFLMKDMEINYLF